MATTTTDMVTRPADPRFMAPATFARTRRCPRCEGNLFLTEEDDRPEWSCLQCGRSYPTSQQLERAAEAPRKRHAA